MLESFSLTGCGDAFAKVKVGFPMTCSFLNLGNEWDSQGTSCLAEQHQCCLRLQDPTTPSMGAGIDRKVLQSFRLDPGTVLVLKQVSPYHYPKLCCDPSHVLHHHRLH